MRWLRMLSARRREFLIRQRRRRFRQSFIESLEERRVMDADAWHNVIQPLNVSGERQQFVSPLDALLVINELNTRRYTDSQSGIFKPGENTDHFFFDVTCDSFVTPLDALYVINALNTNQYDKPWQSDFPYDGSDAAAGRIVSSSCSPRIVEGNSLAPELNRSFVLPDNSSAVRVVFETPNFDSTSQDKLRDAFEITVESTAQSNIALPFRSRVDASLNWSESLSPLAGPGVQLTRDTGNGRTTAVFNLNGVAGGTAITVSARLVNNDGDTNSSVIVRSIEVIDLQSPSPTGLVPSDPNPFPSGRPTTEQLNPTSLQDITGSVRPVYTATTLVESTGSLISDVAVKNVDTNGIGGRIIVAVDSISDPSVSVQSPDGYLAGGRPYFLLNAENGAEWLAPSATSTSRRVQFLNPNHVSFTYSLTALGRVNLPPLPFESVSVTGIEAGRRYTSHIATSDPDGQSLVYSLKTHPIGMVINSATGDVQWQTSTGDIGNHSVTVVATDPFGLSVEQSFQLQVVESLPNRPPIITAAPGTEATVAGSYEIVTLPGGDGVAAVTAALVGSSMKVVTANSRSSDLSLLSRTGTSSVNLGQPPLSVRGLQAGIDVEIGLPDFTHPNDRQQLEWMTQGDFNGDGYPDLATVDFVLSVGTGAQERERFVAVSLGNGDGTFGAPSKVPIRSTTNDGDDDYRPVSSLRAQDFDRDGRVDLAAVTWVTNGSAPRNGLLFWKGLGDGRFEALRVQDSGLAIQKIEPADINSDGTFDLVATTNGLDRVGVLIGRGDGTFESFREILTRPGANYSLPFSFADIDGDGRVDIAMVSASERRVQVLRNDGAGNFQLIVNRDVPDSDPLGVYAADFDGDAHTDLVVLTRQGSEGGGALIYRGTNDPSLFLSPTEAAKGQPISPINFSTEAKPMDLDGDGDLDLTWGHFEGRSGVTVAFNRGNGTFALDTYLNSGAPAASSRNETNEGHVIPSDLNHDGLIDLMVASMSSSSNQVLAGVTVMPAVAQGKYAAPRRQKFDTTGGIAPFTGINYASDFNNDGNVDLLGVVFQNGMRISFGNGDGTFQASVPASSGVGNEFYASGFHADFNRDGFEDALWLGTGGAQGGPGARVLIGFNDGNGAFSIATYSNPQGDYSYLTSVVSGDFNNDGFVDFAGRGDGYTDVWLYAGNNSFTRAVRLAAPLGENTNVISAGDFNLDGREDILIASGRANDRTYGQLITYLGNGDGSFQSGLTQDFFKSNSDVWAPKWSAVGDINEDGIPDLAISSAYSRTTLLIGRGDGSFEDETEYVSGSFFAFGRNIYLRDINHDTHLDLLEVDDNQGRSALRIRYGSGDGKFSEPESYGMPGGVPYLDFADVNEDGAEDVIAGTQDAGFDTSTILLGRIPTVNGVAAADINGDSRDDLISLSSDLSRIHIQTNLTGDKFIKQPDLIVGSRPVALALGDLNADGRTDLVTANDLGKSLTLLKANIDGGFTREDISLGHRLSDVTIGRLNSDAYPDLVTISEEGRTVIVLAGSPTGYSVVDTMALSTRPEHLALGDVTGDGLTDAIVTLPAINRIMVLPGDGSGHWSTPKFVDLSSRPGPLQTADLNADGTADMIVTLPDEDRIALVMARNGRFSSPQKLHVGAQPSSIDVIDWNNDGRPDFVVGNSKDNTVSVVINHYDPTQVYSSNIVAIDPDGDSITYELIQAPDGMLLDPVTGQFLWAPVAEQIGTQNVVVRVSDNRGGETLQGFPIQVTSPNTNHAPVIFSTPPESIVADQSFVTTVSAQDADGDALRYRLIKGPSSAQLDPVSGELRWDPRADAVEVNTWTYQQGSIVVPFTSTLQTPSITIEGVYRLNRLDLSQTFFRKFSYMPYPFGIDTLELRYQAEGSLRVSVSDGSRNDYQYVAWRPEADRWYHLAVTFDDSSRTMRLLVDGTVILATQLDHGLQYDGNPLSIGSGFNDRMIGSVANFRMWNVARTAAQIRDDWARQLAPDATGLTLDYRFDSGDALTVHDYSQFSNDGRRVTQSGPMPSIVSGLAAEQVQDFTIEVEDGKGGTSRQQFSLHYVPIIAGSISGTLYADTNGNSVRDSGESPLSGWTLYLDENHNGLMDADEARTVSQSNGAYLFNRVFAGSHMLRIQRKVGFETPASVSADVQAGLPTLFDRSIKSEGGLALSTISGHVHLLDSNHTVLTDPSEWVVYLDVNGNGLRDSDERFTSTDQDGNYRFVDLSAGQYTVAVDNSAGWTTTVPIEQTWTVQLPGLSEHRDFTIEGTADAVASPRWVMTSSAQSIAARETGRWVRQAIDPNHRPLTYSLLSGPEGMAIDPRSGTIVWTPTLAQIGSQRVIVRAVNDTGLTAVDAWTINVAAPNTSPFITGEFPSRAAVNRTLQFQVAAQDAEDANLRFALVGAPNGATIDSVTGVFRWTPDVSQAGQHQFAVSVDDNHGHVTTRSIQILVEVSVQNASPIIRSELRQEITVGELYRTTILADDADGDALTYSLVSGPAGASLSDSGVISWTPSPNQTGSHPIQVLVTDGHGGQGSWNGTIRVVSQFSNSVPKIDSESSRIVLVNREYAYDVQAEDSDHDPLFFSLPSAPAGMSIDSARGTVRWVPTEDQAGSQRAVIRVVDSYGAAVEQVLDLSVRRMSSPPLITSVPATTAVVGQTYLMRVAAVDLEGDPLEYRLLAAPQGMAIDSATGQLTWTPGSVDIGQHSVLLEVSEPAGGFTTQAFKIEVAAGSPNQPPVITSLPHYEAVVGSQSGWQVTATDPEGSSIVYSLAQGPSGMIIDSQSGLITWTPTSANLGQHIVSILAADGAGGAAVQSFEIDTIAANTAPRFTSFPSTQIAARAEYRYDARGADVDSDPLRFELLSGPSGMTMDTLGRIRWQTSVAYLGIQPVRLRISDSRGGSTEQVFAVNVVPDTAGPRLSVVPAATIVRANSPEVFQQFNIPPSYPTTFTRVSVSDNVGVTGLRVTANGKPIALDAQGLAHFDFQDWGFGAVTIVAQAEDAAGNTTNVTRTFAFIPFGDDPAVSELANPVAVITSPTSGGSVRGFVDVIGSAKSDHFSSYRLTYRRADLNETKLIASGSSQIDQAVLGKWDTSLLENDEYILRLEVEDQIFGTTVFESSVGVSGNFKLGNYRLGFEDLGIAVGAIPITIARTYDSLRSDREGDFGYGWRLDGRNADLRTSLPKSGMEDLGIYTPYRVGTRVFVTLPGGVREGFTFTPEIRVLPGFGQNNGLVLAVPKFTPDPGVTTKMSAGGGSLFVDAAGQLFAAGGIPWNPSSPDFGGYTLTTLNGTQYTIDGNGMLTGITDLNGNTLVVEESGIRSSTGDAITFTRDSRGRIVGITDPAGKTIRYEYSSRGDLQSVTDREGNKTVYQYDSQKAHYLSKVIDPLGRTGSRVEYDADGRLIRSFSGSGSSTSIAYDIDNELMTVADPLGNQTTTEFDALGNIVRIIDATGAAVRFTHDDSGNVTSKTDALGRVSRFAYDAAGNVIESIDTLGNRTRVTYDRYGSPTSEVNGLGHAKTFDYDIRGNLLATVDEAGDATQVTSTSGGRISRVINPMGGQLAVQYGSGDRISKSTDARGLAVDMVYSDVGQLLESRYQTTLNGQTVTLSDTRSYDANGRLISVTDAAGNTEQYEYDAAGQQTAVIDKLGRRTVTEYDADGRKTAVQFPDGSRERYAYDVAGRMVGFTDVLNRETRYQYDAVGRRTATLYPDNTPADWTDNPRTQTEYDLLGNATATTDEAGRRTVMTYDSLGRIVRVIEPNGATSSIEYDAVGNRVSETDPLGNVTRFRYDSGNRLTETISANGRSLKQAYNSLGLRTKVIDASGAETAFEYSPGGLLEAVVDSLGSRTEYRYDNRGHLIETVDANGRSTRFTRDALGREVGKRLPAGQLFTTQYDAVGNVLKTVDADGNEIRFEYDVHNYLTKKIAGNDVSIYIVSADGKRLSTIDERGTTLYQYDVRDRLVTQTEPDGQVLRYTYDASGKRLSLEAAGRTERFTYDSTGRLASVQDDNGRTTRYVYDLAGRLTQTLFENGITESRLYNDVGEVLRITASDGNTVLTDFVYAVDVNGRVTRVGDADGRATEYSYDRAGRLTAEVIRTAGSVRSMEYDFDLVGNRLRKTDSSEGITTYGYDANDRLASSNTRGVITSYTYNASGDMLTAVNATEQLTNTWDVEHRLIRSSRARGAVSETETYQYDDEGNRIRVTKSDGESRRFLLDTNDELAQITAELAANGVVLAEYTRGLELISINHAAQTDYYLSDRLGSVRLIVDANGVPRQSFAYDAYGVLLSGDVGDGAARFTGEPLSAVSGYTYLRARYYDAVLGRFVSSDPFAGDIKLPISLHKYVYAFADPSNLTDASGKFPELNLATISVTLSTASTVAAVGSIVASFAGASELAHWLNIVSYVTLAGSFFSTGAALSLLKAGPEVYKGTIAAFKSASAKFSFALLDRSAQASAGRIIQNLLFTARRGAQAGTQSNIVMQEGQKMAREFVKLIDEELAGANLKWMGEHARTVFVSAAQNRFHVLKSILNADGYVLKKNAEMLMRAFSDELAKILV